MGTFTVTLTSLPADYNLVLYRGNAPGCEFHNTGTANETIAFNATTTGTYYARVAGANTSAWNATSCYYFEGNIRTATSALITNTNLSQGYIISETEAFDVKLMPNPANDYIMVKPIGLYKQANMVLTDMTVESSGKMY